MFKQIALAATCFAYAAGALAQQPPSLRVAGIVESFDGHVLVIKSEKLGEVRINLPDKVVVFGVSKAAVADIKTGVYIGVGAMPQADGSQRAIQVTVMAESQRGLNEGHRPWDARPNSTMTNGAVEKTVESVDGRMLTVKYKGGEQKIVVPPEAKILAYSVAGTADLKPGVHVAVLRAVRKPDGSLEANRVNVGRGEVIPQ